MTSTFKARNMRNIAFIGLGGLAGAVTRYVLSGLVQKYNIQFPIGTLFVNITGCFILSLLMTLSEYGYLGQETRLLICVGFLGSYTTMSTFMYESLQLYIYNQYTWLIFNFFATNILCLTGVIVGRIVALRLVMF
jgi:CrcB protein